MAFGIAEDPVLSPQEHLDAAEFPVWREVLVRIAADNGAPVDVINLFKSLPRGRYETKEDVQRDFAEAARRFALGNMDVHEDGADRDRRNLGRDLMERGAVHHP